MFLVVSGQFRMIFDQDALQSILFCLFHYIRRKRANGIKYIGERPLHSKIVIP